MQTITDQWQGNDLTSVMLHRHKLLELCNRDRNFRETVLELCRRDIVFFCDNLVFTSDPRNAAKSKPVSIPFILFEKQKECLRWMEDCFVNRKFGLVGKSRDAGISYLCTLFHLHKWLFVRDYVGLLGSRKELLVDRIGDMSSLFGKLRFMIDTLPEWMKPSDYTDGYMKIINGDNGAAIVGEAGSQLGRGSRASVAFLDEAAFLEQADTIMAALSQTADCVIRVSTPNGMGDLFARDYQSGNFPTFQLTWRDDPRKNHWVTSDGQTGQGAELPPNAVYPWYEEQKSKLSPLIIARELDVSFTASAEGVVIQHEWVLSAVGYQLIMTNFTRTAGLDIAVSGDKSVLTILDAGVKVIHIEDWRGLNTTETAHKAISICHQYEVDHLFLDSIGVGQGVLATLQTTPGLRFQFHPVNVGVAPTDYYWQAEQRTSKEKFYNLRAELYHIVALRFYKTWENVNGINKHPTDECISIPNHPTLISQLPMTTCKFAENGKIILTPKKDLVVSPDFADSLVLSLHPIPNPQWSTVRATW